MKKNNLVLYFHNKTKLYLREEKEAKKLIPLTWVKIFFKSYPRFKEVNLPKPALSSMPLDKCIKRRESCRKFTKKPLTKQDVSDVLFYCGGITNQKKKRDWNETRRAYPSAGARYPLELYVVAFNVKGLKQGIYHYNIKKHSLELMLPCSYRKELYGSIMQRMIKKCSILILISAVFDRTRVKYGDRAYRYILLDAGHLAQNIYLKATSLNIGCCTIGGFSDDKINRLLDLNPNEEATIYIAALGRKNGMSKNQN